MTDETPARAEMDPPFMGHRDEHPPHQAEEITPAQHRTEPAPEPILVEPVSRPDTPDEPFMGHRDEHAPREPEPES